MSKYIRETEEEKGTYEFWCPGCGHHHFVKESIWIIDLLNNTLYPSVLVRCPDPDKPGTFLSVCHTFVRDGKIQFLNDCTHKLSGKTVDMVELK